MKVNTVTGEISKKQLGVVTSHEHILLDLTAFYQALPVKGIKDPAKQKVKMWNLGILSRDVYALKDNLMLMNKRVQTAEIARFKQADDTERVDGDHEDLTVRCLVECRRKVCGDGGDIYFPREKLCFHVSARADKRKLIIVKRSPRLILGKKLCHTDGGRTRHSAKTYGGFFLCASRKREKHKRKD